MSQRGYHAAFLFPPFIFTTQEQDDGDDQDHELKSLRHTIKTNLTEFEVRRNANAMAERPVLQRAPGQRLLVVDEKLKKPQHPPPRLFASTSIGSSILGSERSSTTSADGDQSRKNPLRAMAAAMDKSRLSVNMLNRASQYRYATTVNNGMMRPKDDVSTSSTSSSSGEESQAVLSELVSGLKETTLLTLSQDDTIRQLQGKLNKIESRMKDQDESMMTEVNTLVDKSLRIERAGNHRHGGEANDRDPSPSQSDDRREERRDKNRRKEGELTDRIGNLTNENDRLLARCRQLEEIVEDLRAENDAMHKSMDDAMKWMSGMRRKMTSFARGHEECVRGYEIQVADLKDEIDRAMLSEADLKARLEEQMEEGERMKMENREAYQACDVLQREIDVLYEELEESKG